MARHGVGSPWRRYVWAILALLLLLSVGLFAYGQTYQAPVTPDIAATDLPDAEPLPSTTETRPVPPTRSATPTPSKTPAPKPAAMRDPVGAPQRVRILRGNKVVVPFDGTDKMLPYYLPPSLVLEPEHGKVQWLADAGWPAPGAKSFRRSLIVGHITGNSKADVFYLLSLVKKGDIVEVVYPKNQVLRFKVTRIDTADKLEAFTAPDYMWVRESKNRKVERVISIITCDFGNGKNEQNRAKDNRIVQAVRIS